MADELSANKNINNVNNNNDNTVDCSDYASPNPPDVPYAAPLYAYYDPASDSVLHANLYNQHGHRPVNER